MSNKNYILTSEGSFLSESELYGYDPNQYKQGVYSSGRIAYKKDHANKHLVIRGGVINKCLIIIS